MHVAEFTLHAKPGHFQQVAEIYSEFATSFLSDHPALETVLIVGDEAPAWSAGSASSPIATPPTPSTAIPSSPPSTTASDRFWRAPPSGSSWISCTCTRRAPADRAAAQPPFS